MEKAAKVVYGTLGGILLVFLFFVIPKMWEEVDAGEVVFIQDPIDGELHVFQTSGMQWQGMGKVTHYRKSGQFWFQQNKKEEDQSIAVKWNDGGHATISGSVRYDLPTDNAFLVRLHSIFGSQEAIEQQLIKTNVEKAIYMSGPLMTSKESYAEKRNELIFYIEDQASRGVYRTRQIEVEEQDPFSLQKKVVTKVEIRNDKNGLPIRQEISPITTYGIHLYNISINAITYDENVERQITTQQQATMQVQTAIAKSKEAEQRALTVAKEGEASAAKAKWDQEVVKARLVTEAESRKRVAELDVQTAELNKRKAILEGEGEAAKKRALMTANGALEQKLDAWLQERKYAWDAFGKYQGNMVPVYQMGTTNTGTAMQWMEIMGMQAMKNLTLDGGIKK